MDEMNAELERSRPAEDSLSGSRLAGYELAEELGRGGMGIVYRARDLSLQRDVAVKVLRGDVASNPEYEQRFVREARMAARLDHPNIVPVYAAGRSDSHLYMAMQWVRGKTLEQILRERGPLPVREVLQKVLQVADALASAHAAGLIHRDIKPANLMVDERGRLKVMDFGLMRSSRESGTITHHGVYFGTPEYSSPEQFGTEELDGRADLYSLGVVAYEMLSGRTPYAAGTALAVMNRLAQEDPQPLKGVPAAVERWVLKLMSKNRDDRFASAVEVVRECRLLLNRKTDDGRRGFSRKVVWVAAAILLAVGSFAIGFVSAQRESKIPTRPSAQRRADPTPCTHWNGFGTLYRCDACGVQIGSPL